MSTKFQIIELTEDGRSIPQPQFGEFDDGKAAAGQARILTTGGKKFQPRPIEAEEDWRERERERLRAHYYQPLVWADRVALIPDHFAHISLKDPMKVSFTETDAKGKADMQKSLPVTRYLVDYYPNVDQYERRIIQKLHLGQDMDATVLFATTPDQIEWVYDNGPGSCMNEGGYMSDYHPVRNYGAGDLAIAYLEEDGRVTARAICWPEKKIFGRLYGDKHVELQSNLQDEGYLFDRLGFQGARLIAHESSWYDDDDGEERTGFIAPYLDIVNQVDLKDNHLVVKMGGGHVCDGTHGFSWQTVKGKCISCNEVRSDYASFNIGRQHTCNDCAVKAGAVCVIYGVQYRGMISLADGRSIKSEYETSHTFVCPETGERWLKREGVLRDGVLHSPNLKELAA